MHYVSLIVEALRGRPRLVFWTAALTQGALWVVIPSIFYSAPPGDVPIVLAIGHEFLLGSYLGPPLAFWLGEIAFRIAGTSGVYVLAQACIVTTYWAVFSLGRAIVGIRHAALGVLLMVGVAAFTVPSVEFGPAVLAAPFWALALLHDWARRRRGKARRLVSAGARSRPAAADELCRADPDRAAGAVHRRHARRAAARSPLPSRGSRLLLLAIVIFPHAWWLMHQSDLVVSGWEAKRGDGRPAAVLGLAAGAARASAHLGLVLLIVLATGWPRGRRERARAPEIDRAPAAPFGRAYVYVFALAPALDRGRRRGGERAAGAARRRRAAAGAVGPCGHHRRRRPGAALPRAAGVVGLGRHPGGAAARRGRRHRGDAMDRLGRSQGGAAGGRRRPILRRDLSTPHRRTPAVRRWRSTACAAGRARRAEPPGCRFRLGAAVEPVGDSGPHATSRWRAGLAGDSRQHRAAGDAESSNSRRWCRKCRTPSRARCRASCRPSASAGRCCARKATRNDLLRAILSESRFPLFGIPR